MAEHSCDLSPPCQRNIKLSSSLSSNYNIPYCANNVNTPNVDMQSIPLKTYQELNISTLKSDRDIDLVTWYQIRYLDTTSDGFISFKSALKGLQTYFGYSKQTAYNHLNSTSSFFSIFLNSYGKRTLRIFGVKTVAKSLEVSYFSMPTVIKVRKGMSRQEYRALLFDSQFKDVRYNEYKEVNPISRAALEEKTGINVRTQQRYNQVANTIIKPNYTTEQVEYEGKNRVWLTAKQLPNTYISRSEKGLIKGQLKKINKALREIKDTLSWHSGEASGTKKSLKRYFTSVKSYTHTKNRSSKSVLKKFEFTKFSLWENAQI